MTSDEIDDALAELGDIEGVLFLEPRAQFDPCILGICRRFNASFIVYDEDAVIEALAEEASDIDDEDEVRDPMEVAREHYEFNIVGGWVGDGTPAFQRTLASLMAPEK